MALRKRRTNAVDESRRRPAIFEGVGDESSLRTIAIMSRMNQAEATELDARRAMVNMSRGEYLRCAALYELPPSIPAVNREAWRDLGKTLANLNQLVVLMRQHGYDERISDHAITQLLKEVRALRIRLVKAREESGDESEN